MRFPSLQTNFTRYLPLSAYREGGQDLDMFTTVNRPLLMRHAQNILDFMKLNEDWILGNFTISAKPDEVQWDHSKGILTVENISLFIIDGQHRRRAISQLLHELRADLNRARDLEKTEAQQVPGDPIRLPARKGHETALRLDGKEQTNRIQHPGAVSTPPIRGTTPHRTSGTTPTC